MADMIDDALYSTEYDVIVVGTGIIESIVAAAVSRAGQTVLHLDTNDFYGSNFASLHLQQFEEWSQKPPTESNASLTSAFHCTLLHHTKERTFQPRSSSFSLDIQPKMLLSNSSLVDVLVHSGVGRYLDFMAMQGTYMFSAAPQNKNPPIWEVPCSKTDVFKSKLSVLEKRHLMKFLQFVADYGEEDVTTLNERDLTSSRALKRPQNKQATDLPSFDNYASLTDVLSDHFKLSSALQQVVLYAVLLQTKLSDVNNLPIPASLDAIYAFVTSIGKFAPSPYLTPMYGISEVAQSFCRLSAVYNGTYLLRAPLSQLHEQIENDENSTIGVGTIDGHRFKGKHVVMNAMYATNLGVKSSHSLLRGIYVVEAPIQPNVDRLVLVISPGEIQDHSIAIHVLQMDSTMGVCPAGYFLIHLTTLTPPNLSNEELVTFMKAAETHVLPSGPPVWTTIFTVPLFDAPRSDALPRNVHVATAPSASLDTTLETCVEAAKSIFTAICPDAAFLPKSATAEQAEAQEDEDLVLLQQAAQLISQPANETTSYDLYITGWSPQRNSSVMQFKCSLSSMPASHSNVVTASCHVMGEACFVGSTGSEIGGRAVAGGVTG
ncbi:unnamed protein product [Aphanomyces euteiches]|uniref:Rab proteins geranylgeranyltransferase component n=1 Tax=Aphanomyces euteiches TaxID=100861 RepID=A0A6G0XJ43_9STRA|nr:hypothetical protein Ae201684_004306 [Aphanomyces euteiches]KAH9144445.1 hypothetical protein AeRB84_011603 [Aphanomyces euteiches]